jgi:phospholipid-binding lipoprotein MlaA
MAMKGYVAVFIAGLAAFLSGCATEDPSGANDPYEATNRKIFDMNMSLDRHVMKPVAQTYVNVVPEPVRDSVHNFLTNLDLPVTFANDILQGEFERSGETLARLGVNTTLGIGGLFDVATQAGVPFHTEDFGQTLAVWGSGEGPYIMWPFYGPSNPRDTAGTIVDIGFDPLTYVGWRSKFWYMAGRGALNVIDLRARNLDQLDSIERSSVDFYASVRSLYRQNRENEIRNGKPDITNLPNL